MFVRSSPSSPYSVKDSYKVPLPICHFGKMSVEGEDDEWYVLDERDNSIRGSFSSDSSASQAMYEISMNNSIMEVPVVWICGHRDEILNSAIPVFGLPAIKNTKGKPEVVSPSHEYLKEVHVAGFQFHDGKAVWNKMHQGDGLSLKREPANHYDDTAIAVFWKNNKLGYVPANQNMDLADLMDNGCSLIAQINQINPSEDPANRVCIGISKEV